MVEHIDREIFSGFWKVHVLHHAAEGPVVGQWMLEELRRHGYRVSPGTLYPMLSRMESRGWLRCERDPHGGRRARKEYYLTDEGRRVLDAALAQLDELQREVLEEPATDAAGDRRQPD